MWMQFRTAKMTAQDVFVLSHTGFGGVAYAMSVMFLRLQAREVVSPSSSGEASYLGTSDEAILKQGEYRDILSLIRVLAQGPKSEVLVDDIIERCVGAIHVQTDIFNCIQEVKKIHEGDQEHKAYLSDLGVKALSASSDAISFSDWMKARPELGHMCTHLRIDK